MQQSEEELNALLNIACQRLIRFYKINSGLKLTLAEMRGIIQDVHDKRQVKE